MSEAEEALDGQFIFRETEFEDENFHAAAFVAKYRRVTSLESLKDQLRQYCNGLKEQLYGVINRDYKDFITIATKVCHNLLFMLITRYLVQLQEFKDRHSDILISVPTRLLFAIKVGWR
jgi:hypothetical protein